MDYRKNSFTEEEKKKLASKEKTKWRNDEKLKKEKYNPDNLFKNNIKQEYVKENTELNTLIEVKKETFFDKIITFLKKILKIN